MSKIYFISVRPAISSTRHYFNKQEASFKTPKPIKVTHNGLRQCLLKKGHLELLGRFHLQPYITNICIIGSITASTNNR